MTADAHPIIGRVGDGVYAACGFSGHGFMQSPAVGRALAEEILTGASSFDLAPYRLERFAGERRVSRDARALSAHACPNRAGCGRKDAKLAHFRDGFAGSRAVKSAVEGGGCGPTRAGVSGDVAESGMSGSDVAGRGAGRARR